MFNKWYILVEKFVVMMESLIQPGSANNLFRVFGGVKVFMPFKTT